MAYENFGWGDLPLTPLTDETLAEWHARIADYASAHPALKALTAANLEASNEHVLNQALEQAGGIQSAADIDSLPGSVPDGEHPVYLVLDTGDGEMGLYAWDGTEWVPVGGGGGGTDPGGGDGIMAYGHNLAELGEATAGANGLLIVGDEDAGIDFDTYELVGLSGRWQGINKFTVMSQLDTWALGLEDVSVAALTSYVRPREAIMYGRPHTFLADDVTVGDTTVPINNGSQFSVEPFRVRHYTVTPTGFDDPSESFTGCTWARTDGSSNGTETFPTSITPVKQGEVGGYGMVPRIIHRIGAIYSAGFKIELAATAFMVGSADDKAITIGTYLANWNSTDDVPARPLTPTGGLGMVAELTGPPNDNGASNREAERAMTMTSLAWSAISGIASPTKTFGDPDVFAKMAASAEDNGEFYGYTVYGRVVEA